MKTIAAVRITAVLLVAVVAFAQTKPASKGDTRAGVSNAVSAPAPATAAPSATPAIELTAPEKLEMGSADKDLQIAQYRMELLRNQVEKVERQLQDALAAAHQAREAEIAKLRKAHNLDDSYALVGDKFVKSETKPAPKPTPPKQ